MPPKKKKGKKKGKKGKKVHNVEFVHFHTSDQYVPHWMAKLLAHEETNDYYGLESFSNKQSNQSQYWEAKNFPELAVEGIEDAVFDLELPTLQMDLA